MEPTTQTPPLERPPIITYERVGESRANCLVCGHSREIPRFRVIINGIESSAYVNAPMCSQCHNRFRLGLLAHHPWWIRTPQDAATIGGQR